jgi:hypothetical protein
MNNAVKIFKALGDENRIKSYIQSYFTTRKKQAYFK